MICKTLYEGPSDFIHLKKASKKVIHVIAATIFDNYQLLNVKTMLSLLQPDYFLIYSICRDLGIDYITVVEQFPGSRFYKPYKCNFRVCFHQNKYYDVYSSFK